MSDLLSKRQMFCLTKPSSDSIRKFIAKQRGKPFSYSHIGKSQSQAPDGYTIDHNRFQLGKGIATYNRAVDAIKQWKMFDMPWVELCWPSAPIEEGVTVAVLISHLGFWSMNAARVVYVIQEESENDGKKYGFAYGTLTDHAERGEERFTAEYNPEDQSVWYDLYAYSRPNFLARLAHPFTRVLQKRFARDSKKAMQNAVL